MPQPWGAYEGKTGAGGAREPKAEPASQRCCGLLAWEAKFLFLLPLVLLTGIRLWRFLPRRRLGAELPENTPSVMCWCTCAQDVAFV